MSSVPYMPWYVGDYLADCGHLSDADHGYYARLLMRLWASNECRIPRPNGMPQVVSEMFGDDRNVIDPSPGDVCWRHVDWTLHPIRIRNSSWRVIREFVLAQHNKQSCTYCGCQKGPFHVDHVIPRAQGGRNEISNLVVACRRCNTSKGARTPEEWRGASLV